MMTTTPTSTSPPTKTTTSALDGGGGEDVSVIVAGPAAPGERRPVRAILRDSSTRHWVFAVPSALNVSAEKLEVSAICEGPFHALRIASGIAADDIAINFEPARLREGSLKAQFSDGMSSSFFARGLDGSCVLKTVKASELEVLVRLLPAYSRHLRDNPASLLVRFYGAWAMRVPGGARIFFVLMQNVFPIAGRVEGALTFDVKGSTVNRSARTARGGGAGAKGSLLWQDQDLRRHCLVVSRSQE